MKKTKIKMETNLPVSCGTLYIFNKDGLVSVERIEDTVTIGRYNPESKADITIDSPLVSRQHGIIKKNDSSFIYEDINRTNGTFINGKKYGYSSPDGRTEKVLNSGDLLRVDQNDLRRIHPQAVCMIFFSGDKGYRWHELLLEGKNAVEVGRSVSNKKGLAFKDDTTSRKHALFEKKNNYWQIIDNDSTNGVFLNNERIQKPEVLNPMDTVRIADTTFLFLGDKLLYNNEKKPNEELSINIIKKSVGLPFLRKVLLENIRLSIESGELILVIGGSGAGKTTFLDAVLGDDKAKGKIYFDGTDLYKEYSKIKGEIGHVNQQNILREDDIVFNTLLDAAEMKLEDHTRQECIEKVEYVLCKLGLEDQRNSRIKKLSGGQKRRLAIAVELISDPGFLVLDEPDSGLDGANATSLMKYLRTIADEGKIVIVISHQPDRVAELFDKVIVIAKESKKKEKKSSQRGGTLAFFGTIPEAYVFFECRRVLSVWRKTY